MVIQLSKAELEVYENMPIPVTIVKNSTILWMNNSFTNTFAHNLKKEEIIGTEINQFQHPDYQEILTRIGITREAGLPVPDTYDAVWQTKLGGIVHVTTWATQAVFEGKSCTFGLIIPRSKLNQYHPTLSLGLNILQTKNQFGLINNVLYGLNHHINNKLTTLNLAAEFVDNEEIAQRMKHAIKDIHETMDFVKLFMGVENSKHDKVGIIQYLKQSLSKYKIVNFDHLKGKDEVYCTLDQKKFSLYLNGLVSVYLKNVTKEPLIKILIKDAIINESIVHGIITVGWDTVHTDYVILKFTFENLQYDKDDMFGLMEAFYLESDHENGRNALLLTEMLRKMNIGQLVVTKPTFTIYLLIPKRDNQNIVGSIKVNS